MKERADVDSHVGAHPEKVKRKMNNRFNRLTSKEWLPFQKSWFRFEGKEKLYRENIRFFVPADDPENCIFYYGQNLQLFKNIAAKESVSVTTEVNVPIQFALIDLLDHLNLPSSHISFAEVKNQIVELVQQLYKIVVHRRFIVLLVPNVQNENAYFPFAWDLAKEVATVFSLKDEKIACYEEPVEGGTNNYFQPTKKHFYCLYFRKDENATGEYKRQQLRFFTNNTQSLKKNFSNKIPSWFILKPQPRKKNEILHPAKYPEDLPEMFITEFTEKDDIVFDPMSGTGSTQLAALKLERRGFGSELSAFFSDIANQRCTAYLRNNGKDENISDLYRIVNKDARQVTEEDVPAIDYMITSPPYWDMLNMKGAENQAKRVEKGLQLNYSDDHEDLGNIQNYHEFLIQLCDIYFSIIRLMKPGSYLTIVVKNIKKKGSNYPFAWDIANELQKELILLPEVFWCQDDISIAPFGYGNTWVSNTFHQYCLTFQKPLVSE